MPLVHGSRMFYWNVCFEVAAESDGRIPFSTFDDGAMCLHANNEYIQFCWMDLVDFITQLEILYR